MSLSIFDLGIVILLAAALGALAKLLKQPILLAYLVTGAVIGYFGLLDFKDPAVFHVFSDLGIMFLLFLVGMEINYTALRRVGLTSLTLGIAQVALTSAGGFGIAYAFGFPLNQAFYLAIALTFSSTIIVIKLISEKRDLNSLYGKIAIGMLLVQDFVAAFLLVVLAGIGADGSMPARMLTLTILKGVVLFLVILALGRKALPHIFDTVARLPELLFLVALAWVFMVAAAVEYVGFSIAIAGFLAGIGLANSSERFEIASRVRPLRDFFVLIFFVILGSSLALSNLGSVILPLIAFSAFVIIGNPLIVFLILIVMGYRKRTSFMAGLTVGQISEFSLVLAALGLSLGHINQSIASLITGVGVISIIASSYLITHADALFARISRPLSFFERRRTKKENGNFDEDFHKPIILIGAHRTGEAIARNLPKNDVLIIDFDPDVVARLKKEEFAHLFGDMSDPAIFEKANVPEARLLVSTSPDLHDNLHLLGELTKLEKRPKAIVRAENEADAYALYMAGADYVLLPHFTSGQYLGKTIALDRELQMLEVLKKRDLEILNRHSTTKIAI